MSTSKSEAARANGAKSHGPITPAGKAKSAANSLRHGLSAKAIVLPAESQDDYERLLAAYVARFRPADQIEMDLVEAMAVARWRLRRIATIEAHMLDNAMSAGVTQHAPQNHNQRLARVFKDCAAQIDLLTRYEGSLNRTFDRALKQLQVLQKTRPTPEPPKLRNEPSLRPPGGPPRPVAPSPAPPEDLSEAPSDLPQESFSEDGTY